METRLFINGRWVAAAGGATLDVIDPATEEVIASVAHADAGDVGRAFDAAAAALPDWSRRTAYERGQVLKKTAELMRQRADAIARTGRRLQEKNRVSMSEFCPARTSSATNLTQTR